MLTPLALALHELRQLLSAARERVSRAALLGKAGVKQAGRVEAFEESEDILETAVSVQADLDAARVLRHYGGCVKYLPKSDEASSQRVIVPFDSKGGLHEMQRTGESANPDQNDAPKQNS